MIEVVKSEVSSPPMETLDQLPSALLATILTKLDVPSICSVASTSTLFNSSARHIRSFLPSFHLLETAPTKEMLRPLLPPNPWMKTMKLNCGRLDDSAIQMLLQPSLQELCMLNCADFSGKLLSEIAGRCKDLRSLCLESVAEKRGRSIHVSDLEELLGGCARLEALVLLFDVSFSMRHDFTRVWALASDKLTSLEIGHISSVMVTELLSPKFDFPQSTSRTLLPILPNIHKLSLSVDYITDTMVGTISNGLPLLTHLDLRDAPLIEPRVTFDLTNSGLQLINQYGKLKHLSLIRSQVYLFTYFKRVNDLGLLLLADKCANLESIFLGGFCRVTDTGFKTILHSCSKIYKLRVSHGTQLTDLVFHDIPATSLSLTHVSLRRCTLLTNHAVTNLAYNKDLKVLDLRDCRNLGDEALRAIGNLHNLKTLLLDGSDISDTGLSYLRPSVIGSLITLSVRGCKKLTDNCISALLDGCSKFALQELDLSNLPHFSDNGIVLLARSRIPLLKLRMRQCPLIGDTSVVVLASMLVDEAMWHGNSLRLLDLFNCSGITQLSFKWLKKPYYPRLKWLGVTGCVNRDIVDALARNRPCLHVSCRGEELGVEQGETGNDFHMHDLDEMDELEQWVQEGDYESDDDEMVDAEHVAEAME